MANEEQLEILKQGVDAWNLWRKKNYDKKVDLSDAELSKANLGDANLNDANLRYAKLIGAKLNSTDLSDADLMAAKLSGADLMAADLSGASLIGADLQDILFKFTRYNKNTEWPEGFDPKEVEGLILNKKDSILKRLRGWF